MSISKLLVITQSCHLPDEKGVKEGVAVNLYDNVQNAI